MPLNLCDKFYTKTLLWELKLWPDMWKNPGTDSQNLTTLNNSFQTRIKLFRSASLRRGPARINTGNKTRKTFRHPNQRVKRRRGKRTRCWVPPMAFTRTSELQRICVWKNPELVTLWSPPPPHPFIFAYNPSRTVAAFQLWVTHRENPFYPTARAHFTKNAGI